MKTFLQWAEANKLDVGTIVTDTEPAEKTVDEKRMRTGMTKNYPPQYSREQYPELGQTPIKATAVLDFQQEPNPKYGGPRAAN